MPTTEQIIATLCDQLSPVRPLRPPLWRAFGWILFAAAVIAFLVVLREPRTDLRAQLRDPTYLMQLAGAWLTGAAATLAVFNVSLPDRARAWQMLPLPFVALWLSGFAYGCLRNWIAFAWGAPVLAASLRCLETIVMATTSLSIVLWFMLRRTKPLRPAATGWIGALAVAGFVDTAHLLIHVVEASLLVLLINLVPATLIVLLGGLVGRHPLVAR